MKGALKVMYNILTLNSISEKGLAKLKNGYNYSASCENPHGILVRSANIREPQKYENLLAIARAGAGTNNINLEACNKMGVAVFNTPGANANAVKELVIASLILSSRNIIDGANWAKTLNEENLSVLVEAGKKQFKGSEIMNKKLGVIGLGSIGTLVANAACSLDMEVFGYDPFISLKSAWNLCRLVKKLDSLEELFATCDYITIHVPLNANTKNMIDNRLLSIIKEGAKLLNFSRGEIVNSKAIIKAIEARKISNYITDFPRKNFLKYSQIINIPHLGASTVESEENCAIMAAEQLKDFLETGNVNNSINFPSINVPRNTSARLCIFSENVPSVISQVLNIISSHNINIENMESRAKLGFVYSIIDVNDILDNNLLNSTRACSGVIKIRVLN